MLWRNIALTSFRKQQNILVKLQFWRTLRARTCNPVSYLSAESRWLGQPHTAK